MTSGVSIAPGRETADFPGGDAGGGGGGGGGVDAGSDIAVAADSGRPGARRAPMRILLIDDHGVFREGLKLLLGTLLPDVIVDQVADSGSGEDCLATARYDLVLLDWWLRGERGGREAIARLQAVSASARIVVLSGDDRAAVIAEAIEAGAAGFIHKGADGQDLLHALAVVIQGGVFAAEPGDGSGGGSGGGGDGDGATGRYPAGLHEFGVRLSSVRDCFPQLTPRQAEVLGAILRGWSNKQIARAMDIAEVTVKSHVSAVLRAVDANSRAEAMSIATRKGVRVD